MSKKFSPFAQQSSIYLDALSENDKFDMTNTIFPHVSSEAHVRIIKAFLSEYKTKSENYIELIQQWDVEQKNRFCHSLKAGAGNIGAGSLQELARKAEASSLNVNDADLKPLFAELQSVISFLDGLLIEQ